MDKETVKRDDVLYLLRCVPRCDVFDIVECKVHNVTDEYFTVVGQSRTFLLSYNCKDIFQILADAQEELAARKQAYYSSHKKVQEEHLDIHATDEFVE